MEYYIIMDAEKQLRGLIAEMIDEKTMSKAAEIADKKNEDHAKMVEQNAELKAQIEKLQSAPAQKVELPVPGSTEKKTFYKGYNLAKQGMILSLDDARKQEVAKMFVDMIHGKAAMQEGTTTEGGFLVFDEYQSEILAHARLSSVALRDCRILPMASDTLRIPREDGAVSVNWTAEEIALTQSEPTIAEVVLTANKLGAYSIVSNELLADSQFDIVSWLTELFAEAAGQEIDNQWMNGTTFTGILSGGVTTNTVTCTSTTTTPNRHVQVDDTELSSMVAALTSNKLVGAKYYLHRNSLHYIRMMEDTAGVRIWMLPNANQPGTIYGYPYELVDAIPSAPNAGDPFLAFGNMKKGYIIGIRRGAMSLDMDPYGAFTTDQTRFRLVTRFDGAMGLENALVVLYTSGP